MKTCFYICPDICLFYSSTFLKFHISFWLSFLLSRRTSFSISFRAHLLARNYLSFSSSENIFICPSFPKDHLLDIEFFSFNTLKDVPLSSGFHGFWWEILCHLNHYSTVSLASFISDYFQGFLCVCVFNFKKFHSDISYLFGFILSEICAAS